MALFSDLTPPRPPSPKRRRVFADYGVRACLCVCVVSHFAYFNHEKDIREVMFSFLDEDRDASRYCSSCFLALETHCSLDCRG